MEIWFEDKMFDETIFALLSTFCEIPLPQQIPNKVVFHKCLSIVKLRQELFTL